MGALRRGRCEGGDAEASLVLRRGQKHQRWTDSAFHSSVASLPPSTAFITSPEITHFCSTHTNKPHPGCHPSCLLSALSSAISDYFLLHDQLFDDNICFLTYRSFLTLKKISVYPNQLVQTEGVKVCLQTFSQTQACVGQHGTHTHTHTRKTVIKR